MEQKYWWMLTWIVGVMISLWIVTDLFDSNDVAEKVAPSAGNSKLETIKAAEAELGLEGGDTLSGPARMLRVALEGQRQAMRQQQRVKEMMNKMDQLQQQDIEQLGADSLTIATRDK